MSDPRPSFDLTEIRAALPMQTVCEREGVELRKRAGNWVGHCPFHQERSGSFTISGANPDSAHCYGCGWHGDIFAFWGERRGIECKDKDGFKEIVAQLASLAGVAPRRDDVRWTHAAPVKRKAPTLEERGKPHLPKMRLLKPEEMRAVADLRGISIAAVKAASADKRLGFSLWPVDRETLKPDSRSVASWCVTDPSRWVAQFRRMDGKPYDCGRGKDPIKAWSTKGATWVIGAEQIGERENVLLVEGGADMLAGYHFLTLSGSEADDVAVCCVFGGSVNIAPEALKFFRGKRVRICMDADPPKEHKFAKKPSVWKRPGWEAAARWQKQLTAAGAGVRVFSFEGLTCIKNGEEQPVKDLNDLALCTPETIDEELPHLLNFHVRF